MLTEFGRVVLTHLPPWAEDEAAYIEAEGGEDVSVRSYPLPAFTDRVNEHLKHYGDEVSQELISDVLGEFVDAGLVETTADGEYKMTKEGFDEIHAPRQDLSLTPGPALVELNPAQVESAAPPEGGSVDE